MPGKKLTKQKIPNGDLRVIYHGKIHKNHPTKTNPRRNEPWEISVSKKYQPHGCEVLVIISTPQQITNKMTSLFCHKHFPRNLWSWCLVELALDSEKFISMFFFQLNRWLHPWTLITGTQKWSFGTSGQIISPTLISLEGISLPQLPFSVTCEVAVIWPGGE